jgi:hypothetical protein
MSNTTEEATHPALLHADHAAEAIRQLNHATLPGREALDGIEVYWTLGHLVDVVNRLPQALEQIAGLVERYHADGVLRVDDLREADSPARTLAEITLDLDGARGALRSVAQYLSAAHQAASHIYLDEPVD